MCDILNLNAEVSAVKATTSSRAPNIPHRGNVQVQQRLKVKDRRMMDRTHSGSEYLLAEVRYPRTYRHEDKGKFTDYEIYIETNKIAFSRRTSTVRRRYSEFLWLRKQLASVEVNGLDKGSVPELPPKKVIGRFHPAFLTVRQQGLQHFLNSVMKINKFLSYSGLHLFLQSPMTIDEIEDFLEGKYGEKSVEDMLEDFGCATNTDNPFSIFLRSDPASLQINNRPGRSVSYDRLTSTISQDDTHDDTVLSRSSVESSDMSSGSYTGVF